MKHDLHNIKKARTGGLQIQFIVDGKSHSAFSMDLDKAKSLRDKMEIKLKIDPKRHFRIASQSNKNSCIPGTYKPMYPGITLNTKNRNGYEEYYILVNWVDHTSKQKTKSFYACRETTYCLDKMKQTYKRAVKFRKAYEKTLLNGKLDEFDPTKFNLK